MAFLNIYATFRYWFRAARGKCGLSEDAVIVYLSCCSVGFQSAAAVPINHLCSLQLEICEAHIHPALGPA